MLRISEEELAKVLSNLDAQALLQVPQSCQNIHLATSECEERLWQGLLPSTATDSALRHLPAREQYRIRKYLCAQQLPSLPDALRCAADRNHLSVLALLLKARADPNVAADSGAWGVGFTQVGAFPLHVAVKRGNLPASEILLRSRADLDAADQNGRTALGVASASGQAGAVKWLLAKRASVDVASDYGYSALHYAALLPRPELVELLLEAGASPACLDQLGQTPLHVVLNALPKRARREDTSFDPSGYGDEYCYCSATSHGFREDEPEQEQSIRRAAEALLRHGASTLVQDGRERTAADILKDKNRSDLLPWLHSLQRKATAAPVNAAAVAPVGCCAAFWRLVLTTLCPDAI